MTRVVVLGTGGTIGSRFSAEHGAVIAGVGGDQLLRNLGYLSPTVDVVTEQPCNVGSFLFTLELAFGIVKRTDQLLQHANVAGVVVTCGTDTMEEVAYLVAASEEANGLGAVIAFEDEIHAARDATKMHSSRVGAFASAEHGKLGEIDDAAVVVSRRAIRQHPVPVAAIETRVDLVKACMGADGRFIDYAVETGSRGIVLEAFGRGNATLAMTEAVGRAVMCGTHVAVASRSPQGRVAPTYTGGGEHDLKQVGAIFAGDLSRVKTRVLLAVLLGAGLSPEEVRQRVESHAR
jgi:L-asparaginase